MREVGQAGCANSEPTNWHSLIKGSTWRGPSGGHAFYVGGDLSLSWAKIALREDWSPWDLIYFNFATRDPKEVNWYMYHLIGCRYSFDANQNLVFWGAQPGIIYTRSNLYKTPGPRAGGPGTLVFSGANTYGW